MMSLPSLKSKAVIASAAWQSSSLKTQSNSGLLRRDYVTPRNDGQLSLRETKLRGNPFLILITSLILCFTPCQAAVEFDGINDYIESKNISSSLGQKFSVSVWIKANSIGSFSSILEPQWLSNGGPNYRPFTVYLCNTGKIASVFQDTSNLIDAHTSTTILNTTNWYHVVLVFDSTETLSANRNKLFINSNLETKSTSPGCVTVLQENITQNSNLMNSSQPLITGVTKNLAGAESEFFNGKVDDIRIYNRTLSAEEVEALYKSRSKRPSGSLANGLVAHFEMDDDSISEVAAQAKDSSGNLRHGQFIGFDNLVSNGFSTDVPTQIGAGQSLEFDGVDDTIQTNFDLSGEDTVTTSFWFNKNSTSGTKMILELSTNFGSFNNGLAFAVDETSGPCAGYGIEMGVRGNADYNLACLNTAIPLNTWHHYVGIFDKSANSSNETKIFIDGIEQAVYRPPGFTNDNTNNFTNSNFYLMSRANSSNFNSGFLDKIHIYNRALTPSEISFLYNGSGLDPGTSNLEALWTFDDDSALKDSSGNNNHGVGIGGNSLKYTDGVLKR